MFFLLTQLEFDFHKVRASAFLRTGTIESTRPSVCLASCAKGSQQWSGGGVREALEWRPPGGGLRADIRQGGRVGCFMLLEVKLEQSCGHMRAKQVGSLAGLGLQQKSESRWRKYNRDYGKYEPYCPITCQTLDLGNISLCP